MAKDTSKKDKIKIKDLIRAAKRNSKVIPKKTMCWLIGGGLAIIVLLIVWINDLINIFG